MIDSLREQREALATKLAPAREQHQKAAYEAATEADRAARKRAATLSGEVKALEAELETLNAAIEHAEKIEAEQKALADEQAHRAAAEERRRALQRAINTLEQSLATAAAIDQRIEALGEDYRQFKEQFEAGASGIAKLLDPLDAQALGSIDASRLRAKIVDRLAGADLVNHGGTSHELQARVREGAEALANRFINAAQTELQLYEVNHVSDHSTN